MPNNNDRFKIIIFCFFSTIICYVDRVNMSIAIIPMAESFDWNQTTRGVVLSSFFYGYMATQVLGGWLSDRFSGKVVLGVGVLVWSFFTMLTPFAAGYSLVVLFLVRVGMGFGEGFNFPAIQNLIARWFPPHEQSRAAMFNVSGVPLGTIIALLLTPIIVTGFSWAYAFYIFGVIGIFWYILWSLVAPSTPVSEQPGQTREPKNLDARLVATVEKNDKIPLKQLLSKAPVWAIIINHFCANWTIYIILAWLPTFLNQKLGVEFSKVGLVSVLPYIIMFVVTNLSGWLADYLLKVGFSTTWIRKSMQTVGYAIAVFALLKLPAVDTLTSALLYLSIAMGGLSFCYSAYLVNHLDIGPRYAGTLLGITNTFGSVPGIIGVALTGLILDMTASWDFVFWISAAICIFGSIVWLLFATGKKIFE